MSSASMNEGWLSEDACLVGESNVGVPARLMGLEKLKEGRGRAEDSELTDGERLSEPSGEAIALLIAGLPDDSFRGGREWKDPPILLDSSSSVGTNGDDIMLEDRLGNKDLGGARPSSSNEPSFCFSGELVVDSFWRGDGREMELSLRLGELSISSLCTDWCSDRIGDGESSLRAPKSVCSPICCRGLPLDVSRFVLGSAGTASSGVGVMRLIRVCIDLGRCSVEKASSISGFKPSPVGLGANASLGSVGDSWDIDLKYSERP